MTREDMEQIIPLKNEIKAIEDSMKSPKSTYVSAFYKDYRTGKGIPKSIQGYDNGETVLKALEKKLNARKKRLIRKIEAAEKFIDKVEDSEMRTILRMYYINGDNQQEIGKALHYDQSTISNRLKYFWLNNKS